MNYVISTDISIANDGSGIQWHALGHCHAVVISFFCYFKSKYSEIFVRNSVVYIKRHFWLGRTWHIRLGDTGETASVMTIIKPKALFGITVTHSDLTFMQGLGNSVHVRCIISQICLCGSEARFTTTIWRVHERLLFWFVKCVDVSKEGNCLICKS